MKTFLDKPQGDSVAKGASSSSGSGGGGQHDNVRVADMGDDEVELAFQELEAMREEFRQGEQLWGDDFKTNIFGGAWTNGNRATAGDRIKAWPANKDSKEFANQVFKLKEGSWPIKLYTQRGACACALLWCRRLQHFFDMCLMQGGGEGYRFIETDVQSAPDQHEQIDTLDHLPEGHPALLRLAEVAAIAPPII